MACIAPLGLRRYAGLASADGARSPLVALIFLAGALLAGSAQATAPRGTPVPVPLVPVPVPVLPPSSCWIDIRLFHTLRLGPVPFCRRNLRYRPGRFECYQFTDQVCATWVPTGGWVTSRSPIDTQVFACPDGPEPPVCRQLDLPALP